MHLEFSQTVQTGKFSGKTFCITGSFDGYSREQLKEILENM